MSEILPFEERSGAIEQQFPIGGNNTQMTVVVSFGAVPSDLNFKFLIEQRLPANDWSVVGGTEISDLAAALFDKTGNPVTSLMWRFSEQIVDDIDGWESARDVQIAGNTYKQLAFRPLHRITVETSAPLEYGIDIEAADVAPPNFQIPNIESA